MSGRKSNSPWRGVGSLTLPGSPAGFISPAPGVRRATDVSKPIELDMDAIAEAVAKANPTAPRFCEGKDCGARLNRYTRGPLCNSCQAKQERRRVALSMRAAELQLKQPKHCGCGRILEDTPYKRCRECRRARRAPADANGTARMEASA